MSWSIIQAGMALVLLNTIFRDVFAGCSSLTEGIKRLHNATATEQLGLLVGVSSAVSGLYDPIRAIL